ncbi:histone acetyltransferase type B catalytic subunit [Rhizophagus irregularis DAOM 181602=DAOM 197198]|nr:histone acetyltransferase type B catalytic subunit [Rhizophagus irregularis DAOM 181602=DAOM 197198]
MNTGMSISNDMAGWVNARILPTPTIEPKDGVQTYLIPHLRQLLRCLEIELLRKLNKSDAAAYKAYRLQVKEKAFIII